MKNKIIICAGLLCLAIGSVIISLGFDFKTPNAEIQKDKQEKLIHPNSHLSDGPYLFYKKSKIILQQFVLKDGKVFVTKQRYNSDEREDISFACNVDSDQNDQFEVHLQSTLNVPPSTYGPVDRLLALSDIEGNFYALRSILTGAKVMDDEYKWSFGDGHLVLVGDFFDRGQNVTECLWLLYDLERQAKNSGGMVHFILGNHEIMNLSGDHRYTKEKYLQIADALGMEYKDLYGDDTELGKWLRTKNVMEKIGPTLFVHGGVSKELVDSKLSLDEINGIARQNLGLSQTQIRNNGPDAELVFGSFGPLWYRGYFEEKENIEKDIEAAFSRFGIQKIIVGHTMSHDISKLYCGKVCSIDVHQPINDTGNPAKALLMENGSYYKINDKNQKSKIEE